MQRNFMTFEKSIEFCVILVLCIYGVYLNWNTITMRHEYPKRNGSKLCRNIDTETQTLDVKLLESENERLHQCYLRLHVIVPNKWQNTNKNGKVFIDCFFLIQFAVVHAFSDYCTGKFNWKPNKIIIWLTHCSMEHFISTCPSPFNHENQQHQSF